MDRRTFLSASVCSAVFLNTHARTLIAAPQQASGLVADDVYLKHSFGKSHPESAARLVAVNQAIGELDISPGLTHISLMDEVMPWIKTVHTESHIRSLQHRFPEFHQAGYAVVQGVLAATDAVGKGRVGNAFCATRPPGHHAENTGQEQGFCFYNSIAIAARYAQQQLGFKKILIVDWDYHHGNGTETAFYADGSVLFFSSHDKNAYPGTGDPLKRGEGDGYGLNINVHLPCGCNDEQIVKVYTEQFIPAVRRFKPDMILISAGFDSRKDDLLGCFDITDQGFIELTKMVMNLADEYCEGRIVSVLEGGYNIAGNASAVKEHIHTLASYKTSFTS